MPQLQFTFSNCSWLVTNTVERDLKNETPVTTVDLDFTTKISGSLTLAAETEDDLEAAVAYLGQHPLYKYHFKAV